MKLTDGLFHKVFDEIAAQYPDIENEHWIVDIGAAKLADTPEAFDVLSDAESLRRRLVGCGGADCRPVGLAGSANIGEHVSMFSHITAQRRCAAEFGKSSDYCSAP